MQPEDALPTIAEVAITMAGFMGVLLAFRPSGSAWSRDEIVRAQGVFTTTAVVVLCGFLPFGVAGLSESPAIAWGVPLCTYAVLSATQQVFMLTRGIKATIPLLSYAVAPVQSCVYLLALLSGLGLFVPYSAGVLVLGLTFDLLLNGAKLVLLVVFWRRPPAA